MITTLTTLAGPQARERALRRAALIVFFAAFLLVAAISLAQHMAPAPPPAHSLPTQPLPIVYGNPTVISPPVPTAHPFLDDYLEWLKNPASRPHDACSQPETIADLFGCDRANPVPTQVAPHG